MRLRWDLNPHTLKIFPKINKLPQVGFEPTTLCSLDRVLFHSATEAAQMAGLKSTNTTQYKSRQSKASQQPVLYRISILSTCICCCVCVCFVYVCMCIWCIQCICVLCMYVHICCVCVFFVCICLCTYVVCVCFVYVHKM